MISSTKRGFPSALSYTRRVRSGGSPGVPSTRSTIAPTCVGAQLVERDLRVVGLVGPAHRIAGAMRGDQQHGGPGQALDEERQVLLGRLVDPVQVFDEQHVGTALATRDGERLDGLERLLPPVLGRQSA